MPCLLSRLCPGAGSRPACGTASCCCRCGVDNSHRSERCWCNRQTRDVCVCVCVYIQRQPPLMLIQLVSVIFTSAGNSWLESVMEEETEMWFKKEKYCCLSVKPPPDIGPEHLFLFLFKFSWPEPLDDNWWKIVTPDLKHHVMWQYQQALIGSSSCQS